MFEEILEKIMFNNNHKNPTCAFAEQVISYLYGETGTKEKTEFEAHLNECSSCVGELSELGFVRSTILEWRKEEFSKLDIAPMPVALEQDLSSVSSVKNDSFISGLRRLFTFSPAFSMAGLAVLIVFAGLILFIFNYNDKNVEVARENDKQENAAPAVSKEENQINAVNLSEENTTGNSPEIVSGQPDTELKNPEIKKTNSYKRKNPVIKTEKRTRNSAKEQIASVKVDNSKIIQKKTQVNKNIQNNTENYSQALKLTNFDDVEDNSLRLADLLGEVDSKN